MYYSYHLHIPPYKSISHIFNLRPPKPKLNFVWDVDIFFRYFEQQGIIRYNCNTETYNPTVLLGAHRLSTIKLFSISNMVLIDLSVTFIPTEVLKHS